MFKRSVVVVAAVLLAACGASKPRPRPPLAGAGNTPSAASPRPPATGRPYRINSARSELRLLVYRAGPMARLGHNHVIVNRTLSGWIDVALPVTLSSFSLDVPSANFSVDETQLRIEEGADFAEPVPDEARAGTLHNLLSDAVLDAARFPSITLASVSLQPAGAAATTVPGATALSATVTVTVAGHVATLVVPFVLENSGGQLSATGTAVLRQSELGLTPFSLLLGALQVRDDLLVKFKVVAEAD